MMVYDDNDDAYVIWMLLQFMTMMIHFSFSLWYHVHAFIDFDMKVPQATWNFMALTYS